MIRALAAVVEALDAAADKPSTLPALPSTLPQDGNDVMIVHQPEAEAKSE